MEREILEDYISSNKIKTIPSNFWRSKEPSAFLLLEPIDITIAAKQYPPTFFDKNKTFNVTVLFQKEEFYNTNDIIQLTRFLLLSNFSSKYNITYKFNYDPGDHLIKTFKLAKINYIGYLENIEEYYSILQHSHVIISPHRTNYSGRYLAEAALFAVPIIASPTGGSMQFLDQNNCVFLKSKNSEGSENFVPCHECFPGAFSLIESSYPNLMRFAYRARVQSSRLYNETAYISAMKSIREATEV